MNVYFLRHGFTGLNKEGIFNGQVDEDIIEEGIEAAKEASKIIKDLPLDIIYCSPLLRARHTCEIVNVNNVPVIYDDRLKERTLGKLDGNKIYEPGFPLDHYYDYNYKMNIEGAEDVPVFYKRVFEFLDELKQKDYKNVLIVAHGGNMEAAYCYFNGIPEDGNTFRQINNCEINKYEL